MNWGLGSRRGILGFNLLMSALFAASSAHAAAAGGGLPEFFRSLQGQWAGDGVMSRATAEGGEASDPFRIELRVERDPFAADGKWNSEETLRLGSNVTAYRSVSYLVDSEGLLVNDSIGGRSGWVEVLHSGPEALVYRVERIEPLPYRVYEITATLSLDGSRGELVGITTTRFHGKTVEATSFTAHRR